MAQEFIGLSLQFIAKNWINIAWALLAIFLAVSYIIINNIQFNEPQKPEKQGRRIILETLKNKIQEPNFNKMIKKGFCDSHKDSHTLEKSCNKLSQKSCNSTSCCVYAHNAKTKKSKCVAGDEQRGPIYKTDKEGTPFTYDYWYYLGKKYNVKN